MSPTQDIIKQLDTLLADYDTYANQSAVPESADRLNDGRILANRMHAAIERNTLPGSSYAQHANRFRDHRVRFRLPELRSVISALRADLAAGWLASVVELVHADTHNDFLEMAEELLTKKYKDAAAVTAAWIRSRLLLGWVFVTRPHTASMAITWIVTSASLSTVSGTLRVSTRPSPGRAPYPSRSQSARSRCVSADRSFESVGQEDACHESLVWSYRGT